MLLQDLEKQALKSDTHNPSDLTSLLALLLPCFAAILATRFGGNSFGSSSAPLADNVPIASRDLRTLYKQSRV